MGNGFEGFYAIVVLGLVVLIVIAGDQHARWKEGRAAKKREGVIRSMDGTPAQDADEIADMIASCNMPSTPLNGLGFTDEVVDAISSPVSDFSPETNN